MADPHYDSERSVVGARAGYAEGDEKAAVMFMVPYLAMCRNFIRSSGAVRIEGLPNFKRDI
jgi:hypothetical protein